MEHALNTAELLNVWERGRSQSPVDRALALLAVASPDFGIEKLSDLKIGQRDARLLELRKKIFGARMTGQADCPSCGQHCEMSFDVTEVQAATPGQIPESITTQLDGYEIRFRLPDSSDLAAVVSSGESENPKRLLLQRCVLQAQRDAKPVAADRLPETVVAALSERMAELDPQGDVQLALNCPHCHHHWNMPLDIVSFVWSEIHAWALRLLRDVHVLASTYGWSEADLLAMSSRRRQTYLELIER